MKNRMIMINMRWFVLILAAYFLTVIIGKFYHPWDVYLESYQIQYEEITAENNELLESDDSLKNELMALLLSESTNDIIRGISNYIVSPITDIMRAVIMGFSFASELVGENTDNYFGVMLAVLTVGIYCFLFYLSETGRYSVLKLAYRPYDLKMISLIEKVIVSYLLEGVFAFLFLAGSFAVMRGMMFFEESSVFTHLNDIFRNDEFGLLYLVLIILSIMIIVLFLVIVSGFELCGFVYGAVILTPIELVSRLPVWIWHPLKLFVCVIIEALIFGLLLPWMMEKINLWNYFGFSWRITTLQIKLRSMI